MRAAGIPARVVTGYQGGEINPINNELVVRQADAHAWVEVWLAERGWVRLDPTGAVSPLRLEQGVNAALGPIGVIPQLIAADKFRLLATLRFAWQAMNSDWDRWIVGYNVERQRQLLSRFGVDRIEWWTLALWLAEATLVIGTIVVVGLLLRDRAPKRDASVRAWNRFCAKLADAGLERAPHEGPLDYLRRVSIAQPAWAPEVTEITRLYIDARYGEGITPEVQRTLERLVRDFRPTAST
jgi:protein-glutamine gamma-glutamyltransferase